MPKKPEESITQRVPYEHEFFKPGEWVIISEELHQRHPQSPLSGKRVCVTTGLLYPNLEKPEFRTGRYDVPAVYNGETYSLEEEFVTPIRSHWPWSFLSWFFQRRR